jgi:hypothetical protein
MARRLLSLVFGIGVLTSATPLIAHHSVSGEFDSNKPVKFTGKVKQVEWGNPHIYTQVETTDPTTGKPIVFRIEGSAPNTLFRAGWRKDSLKAGETVTVSGNRAKNPDSVNVGQATILNAAGQRMYVGQNPAAESAQSE